jgi:NlpC/P60 family putative phage cell wall peptidase
VPAYSADWAEFGRKEALLEAALALLKPKPLTDAECGDVLLFRMREGGLAKHLGIQSEVLPLPRFIHAYSGHSVTESPLSTPWARRICGRFTFPSGAV